MTATIGQAPHRGHQSLYIGNHTQMTIRHLFTLLNGLLLGCFTAGCNHPAPPHPFIEWRLPVARTTPSATAPAGASAALRVVTFNVHRISGAALTRAVLADEQLRNADIILMQEVYKSNDCSPACEVAAALGMHSMYAPGHGAQAGSDGVAILSRTPLRDAHVIELPDNFVMFNGGRRVALAAFTTIGATPVQLVAVHLENRISVAKRRAQLAPVLQFAKQTDVATIITGDMNTSPFTWAGGILPFPARQGRHLEDLARSAGFDTPVVNSGPTTPWLSMKLDAIYTRNVRVLHHGVAKHVTASDHYPLWAELELPISTASSN